MVRLEIGDLEIMVYMAEVVPILIREIKLEYMLVQME
jgi:hypothetical protein